MPIQSDAHGNIMVDGQAGMTMFHLLQLKHSLNIEIRTGMRNSRGSVMNLVNREYDQNFRVKKKALAFILEKIADKEGELREENREAEELRLKHAHDNGLHEGTLDSGCPGCRDFARASLDALTEAEKLAGAPDWSQ